ncbi:hypothetical protein BpHYR1_004468 [Brachionus plicatilis]|uniref:Uncharacterized protein n=1 Tax=Brachionus plicatilis TaxID=10195 RepID=A0A3M7SA83_BRAPC|nr:hypothetical protein BpHYR1_004468 [Brachionus plicatilis]
MTQQNILMTNKIYLSNFLLGRIVQKNSDQTSLYDMTTNNSVQILKAIGLASNMKKKIIYYFILQIKIPLKIAYGNKYFKRENLISSLLSDALSEVT